MSIKNCMEHKSLKFLWELISFSLLLENLEKAQELAANVYELSIDLPTELEEQVVEFWSTGDESLIKKIALTSVKQHYFNDEQHIILIGLLVEKSLLTINDAALMLASISVPYSNMDAHIKRVIDAVWLVNEDSNYGAMGAGDDSLLQDALKDAITVAKHVCA